MIHEFDPVIYPRLIWITYDATFEELIERFPNGDGEGRIFDDMLSCFGATYVVLQAEPKKGGILIRFKNKKEMTTPNITHECIHAANYILDYVGIEGSTSNDEALAYLATWIAKCCDKVKNSK